jgi:hypothetical protein
LRALRATFGFRMFDLEHRREWLAWLAAVAVLAEGQVAHQLTRGLLPEQAKALDALLRSRKAQR